MINSESAKILFAFAHRGEARAFIDHFQMRPMASRSSFLFESENAFLLITEEGKQAASEKLSFALGVFGEQVGSVINLGIAGAVSRNCQMGEIYEIRTAYAFLDGAPVYRSFPMTKLEKSKVDCITTEVRVLDSELASCLGAFAHLVDRELWGIASVCKFAGVPVRAFKLVSDDPRQGGSVDLCQDIRAKADMFSEKLLKHYLLQESRIQNGIRPKIELVSEGDQLLAFQDADLHFTTSMKNQYQQLLSKNMFFNQLSEEELLQRAKLGELKKMKTTGKAKALLLIETLKEELNPSSKRAREALKRLSEEFRDFGIQLKFDESLETERVQFQFSATNGKEVDALVHKISQFSFQNLKNILDGEDA